MNVIVSNKQKNVIDNANIDAIKVLNGLFKVDDVINNFRNYFFTKMVIDATSIVEFANPKVLKKLANGIGSDKLVILLPIKPEPPRKFIEMLISLGIYNFSSSINDIVNFIQNSNTYDDVKRYLEEPVADIYNNGIITDNNNGYNNGSIDNYFEEENNYQEDNYELDNDDYFVDNNFVATNKYILGIKNATDHAGTTSLIYMLKNTLEYHFKKQVLAIEVNSKDFVYFRSQNMLSISENEVENTIRSSNCDIILLDLNNNDYQSLCNEMIYLVNPSIISVNRLITEDPLAFTKLKNEKVILNQSLISNADISKFSQEAGISFYFVIPPLNDRVGNSIIENLVNLLRL